VFSSASPSTGQARSGSALFRMVLASASHEPNAEVRRATKPGGVLAVSCYHERRVSTEVDPFSRGFSSNVLGRFLKV
jgi:hypothetical protein